MEEHTDGGVCRCYPDLQFLGDQLLVIHRAYDDRQEMEEIKNILNLPKEKYGWKIIFDNIKI